MDKKSMEKFMDKNELICFLLKSVADRELYDTKYTYPPIISFVTASDNPVRVKQLPGVF